ncbi:MAG: ABC transporter permease [Anaerolineae bacterium]
MFSTRWRKVLRDLWKNKARTILAVLSIAVGVFAVGMIVGSQALFASGLQDTWQATKPASATLSTSLFDEEIIQTIRRLPGVRDADAMLSFGVRRQLGPDNWQNMQLHVYPDYENMRVMVIRPVSGAWPPPERELLIERASLAWMGVQEGDVITVEAPNGKLRQMRVSGIVHDAVRSAASWEGRGHGYVSAESLEWLGMPNAFSELNIVVTGDSYDRAFVQEVVWQVRHKLEAMDMQVWGDWVFDPDRHPASDVVDPIMMLMGVLGGFSLVLSGVLVVNTIQALLAQQVRQVGIMKALGAQQGQIMGMYLVMVLCFCVLALAIAVPLGVLGAQAMTGYMASIINFDLTVDSIPISVLGLEAAVGLVVPLVAALVPVLAGARVSVAKAINAVGVGSPRAGLGWFDRALGNLRSLPRPLLLSLRNTFRRKGRLAFTLSTLVLASAIFVGVFSVRDSLMLTLDGMYDYLDYDVFVAFDRSYRIEQLEREARRVPGVIDAEAWRFFTARPLHADGTEGDSIWLRACRPDSGLVHPDLVSGRWLVPGDENAVVINTFVLKSEPEIEVGDALTFKIDDKEVAWTVVGIIKGTPPAPFAFTNIDYFSQVEGGVGRGGVVFVRTLRDDALYQTDMAKALEAHFTANGLGVASTQTQAVERATIASQFNVLVVFLLIMAVLLAVVGAIGLMGTMSINVLERTREIGVMRAVGASDGTVLRVIVVEGVLIGLLGWSVGAGLSVPIGRILSDAVGNAILRSTLAFSYSYSGLTIWLGVIVGLAALASYMPAHSASRLTVREILAYE